MKQNLWDRIQRGMEAGFDSALSAVHVITEKAGETIELTRLRREKAHLENKITKQLAKLGHVVYEKISQERLNDISKKLDIEQVLLDIAQEEARMVDIDKKITVEQDTAKKQAKEENKKNKK